ncbi:MAG: phenylalanine--tRNA ligase subunit beta, partial [Oscillospiraceae bacterium]
MDLSMRWLSDYVKLEQTPKQFSDAMTMSGSKVEGWRVEGCEIDKVLVGKILSIEPHPHADSLVICQVDVGAKEPLQIVTGAKNLAAGDLVPVAVDGASLPGGHQIV